MKKWSHLKGTTALASAFHVGISPGTDSTRRRPETKSHARTEVWSIGHVAIDLRDNETGLVVCNPMRMTDGGIHIKDSRLDAAEIRRALLYWDKIVWPSSNMFHIDGGPDIDFLEESGVLSRPKYGARGHPPDSLVQAYLEAYKALDSESPGRWAMSSLSEEFIQGRSEFMAGRGVLAKLYGAVPVPSREVPFADILEFRERNRSALLELRHAIGDFYQSWTSSEDRDHQFTQAISRIDLASRDAIRLSRASKLPFSLSSWEIGVSLGGDDIAKAIFAFLAGQQFGLGALEALGLAVPSFISFGRTLGESKPNGIAKTFSYVSRVEAELG